MVILVDLLGHISVFFGCKRSHPFTIECIIGHTASVHPSIFKFNYPKMCTSDFVQFTMMFQLQVIGSKVIVEADFVLKSLQVLAI